MEIENQVKNRASILEGMLKHAPTLRNLGLAFLFGSAIGGYYGNLNGLDKGQARPGRHAGCDNQESFRRSGFIQFIL